MQQIDYKEIWRQIPPEEKFEMMARAQAKGVTACVITFIIASTVAVGLRMSWIMWGSLILSPFVFQFAAGRTWRTVRPMIVLEYLAARAAARRYAFTHNAKDLTLALMFRGELERTYNETPAEMALRELEAAVDNNQDSAIWVTLFNDSVVLMSARPGGAKLEFAHLLNDRLEIEGQSPSGQGEYSSDREVFLSYVDKRTNLPVRVKVRSKYPASLVVFEKKIQALKNQQKLLESTLLEDMPVEGAPERELF